MRFIVGLLLGLGLGLFVALLLAPERRREEEAGEEEEAAAAMFGENHDTMAGLRRSMRGLQEQIQEAWREAAKAAEEAEREMRARYEKSVSKGKR